MIGLVFMSENAVIGCTCFLCEANGKLGCFDRDGFYRALQSGLLSSNFPSRIVAEAMRRVFESFVTGRWRASEMNLGECRWRT